MQTPPFCLMHVRELRPGVVNLVVTLDESIHRLVATVWHRLLLEVDNNGRTYRNSKGCRE